MTLKEKLKVRAFVKFCQHMDYTSSSTFEIIKLTKGENSVSILLIFMLHERLMDVEDDITDREWRWRIRNSTERWWRYYGVATERSTFYYLHNVRHVRCYSILNLFFKKLFHHNIQIINYNCVSGVSNTRESLLKRNNVVIACDVVNVIIIYYYYTRFI